jgi:hypothetical protein
LKLDLGGDDVAARELLVVEDLAEEPFGQQVLHQHLIDGVAAEVGVEGGLAHGEEVVKSGLKRRILLVGLLDLGVESLGQFGDALLELLDGLLEAFDVRLGVAVEVVEEVGDLLGVGQVEAVAFAAVLDEHGPAGVLKDDVAARVALLELLADLGVEVVVGVLGLPVAARQAELVAQGAVGGDALAADLHVQLGDERPSLDFLGRVGEQPLERGFQGALMLDPLAAVCLEGGVVLLNGFVARLEACVSGHGRVRPRGAFTATGASQDTSIARLASSAVGPG